MNEIVIYVEDLKRSSAIAVCRICHEEEFEGLNVNRLEAPCACSGTVKFAHRDCVQRWCDEKGNTICEICLQRFEPGYTCPSQKPLSIDPTTSAARTRRTNLVDENPGEFEEVRNSTYTSADHAGASYYCRNMTLVVTFLLLIVNAFALARRGGGYPFPICIVFVAKAIGITVPMYIFAKVASIIDERINNYYQLQNSYDAQTSSVDEEIQVGEQHIYILTRP